jgi:hypothetical protein
LVNALGEFGSDMMRNMTLRACLLTLTAHDGMATLPGLAATVDTTQLEHNSMYLQVGIGEKSRSMAGKAGKLDEEDVIPVARKVSEQLADLSDRDIEAIGRELWEHRWDIENHADLARAAAEDTEAPNGIGYAWPGRPAIAPAAPVPPPPASEPEPDPGPVPMPTAAPTTAAPTAVMDPDGPPPPDDTSSIDWDAELRALNAVQSDIPPTGPEAYGLPGQAAIDRLNFWAQKCVEEADEYERTHGPAGGGPNDGDGDDGDGDGPDPIDDNPIAGWCRTPLPEPLGSVLAYIDNNCGADDWVPTAELADAVLGADVKDNAVVLGKALAKNVPGLRAHKDAKTYPGKRGRPAGRGRGYWTADLRRAADAHRAGRNLLT